MAGEDDELFADLKGVDDDDDKKGGGKKEDVFDQLIDLEEDDRRPLIFADDDDDRLLENRERRARTREEMDEIVFSEDDDDDGDGDIEDFTKGKDKSDKGKKNRLQREIRLKAEARRAAHNLLGVVTSVEKVTTEALRNEARTRRDSAQMVMNFAKADYNRSMQALELAKEDGNGQRISELTEQISNARNAYNQAESVFNDLSDEKISKIVYSAEKPTLPRMTKGQDWMDQNPWFNDPKFAAERAAAIEMDKALIKEGSNVDTDEHYTNLTKNIAKKFAHLTRESLLHTNDGRTARLASDGGRRRGGSGKRDATGGASARSSGGSSQSRGGASDERDRISKEERRMLQTLGVDLSDKEARAEYLRNQIK